MQRPKIVLAFSGGLDTSFCAIWLREKCSADIVTATVDTGGFSREELAAIEARARSLGAVAHHTLDGRAEIFRRFVTFLIQGNVLRGRAYPLSVAAERIVQAELVVHLARAVGAAGLAHGSTGAGNDQFRFDGVFRALAPDLALHTPIRDLGWSREQETAWLGEHGVAVPPKTVTYSVNSGLWGTTVGGKETHDPWTEVPESAYPAPPANAPREARNLILGFERGTPVSVDGERLDGVALVERLHAIGRSYGVGRGIHIGDTILGIKGRIGFEAPAPLLLIAAHRELEKIVLTRWQSFWKDHTAEFYGQMLHEGLYYDPVMRDIEAMVASSQTCVTGEARVRLQPGRFDVTGVRSPHSLVDAQTATYGETAKLWTGAEAAGFAKLHALPMSLAHRVRARLGETK